MADEVKKKDSDKVPFFKGVKGEFGKIIWPTRDALTKQTIAVVVVSVILGAIITVFDTAIQYGINLLVK
mgnify:CR=1 FL=1